MHRMMNQGNEEPPQVIILIKFNLIQFSINFINNNHLPIRMDGMLKKGFLHERSIVQKSQKGCGKELFFNIFKLHCFTI
jgi:hypothetical protein